eukprot:3336351-Prymnesium_polylepis.1
MCATRVASDTPPRLVAPSHSEGRCCTRATCRTLIKLRSARSCRPVSWPRSCSCCASRYSLVGSTPTPAVTKARPSAAAAAACCRTGASTATNKRARGPSNPRNCVAARAAVKWRSGWLARSGVGCE